MFVCSDSKTTSWLIVADATYNDAVTVPRQLDPTERFTSRVEEYVRGRPSYPSEIVRLLANECSLTATSGIADVGSGTGLLSELFLKAGYSVACVEPNTAMRAAADGHLSRFPAFVSVAGRAEATGLPDASVDLITAAQAFHWFDPDTTRQEFFRVLRPPRWVALIWNERHAASSLFIREYDRLVANHAIERQIIDHNCIRTESIPNFFGNNHWKFATLLHIESMDWHRLRARLLSTSRMPSAGQSGFRPMLDELRKLYRKHQVDDRVSFPYMTHVYFGTI